MPVFSFVTALVSPSVISVVESSTDDHPKVFFERIIRKCGGLTFSFAGDEMCEIQGDWHSLISVHEILEKVEEAGNISYVDSMQMPDIMKAEMEPGIKGLSSGTIDEAKNVMHEIETVFKEYSDIDDNSIDLNEWHGNHGIFDDVQLNNVPSNNTTGIGRSPLENDVKVDVDNSERNSGSSDEENFPESLDEEGDGAEEEVRIIGMESVRPQEAVGAFHCKVCDFTSKSCKKLRNHMKKMHLEKSHVCLECGKSYAAFKEMKKHMKCHSKNKAYSCEVCQKGFKYIRSLEKHTKKHYANGAIPQIKQEPPILEEEEPREPDTRSFEDLFPKVEEEEMGNVKVDDFDYEEEQDDNSFVDVLEATDQDEFKHMNAHIVPQFHYPMAAAPFRGSEELRAHLLADEEHQCLKCGKIFKHAKTLRAHSITHSEEARFPCPVCQKAFKQQSHLRRHALIHTGERPYPCSVCGKKFRDSSVLRRHVKGVHKMSISVVRELTRIKKN